MLWVLHSNCWSTLFIKEFTRTLQKDVSLPLQVSDPLSKPSVGVFWSKENNPFSPYLSCNLSLFTQAAEWARYLPPLPTSWPKSSPPAAFTQTWNTLLGWTADHFILYHGKRINYLYKERATCCCLSSSQSQSALLSDKHHPRTELSSAGKQTLFSRL